MISPYNRAGNSMQQHPFGTVRHYYGDAVRILFVAVAIMTGVAIPLSGELQTGIMIGAPTIVVLLVLAGLTNPHGKAVLVTNAIVSGVAVVLSQYIAIQAYDNDFFSFFAFMEFVSIVMMAALYFSVKNVRASVSHKIGQIDGVGEFDEVEN